MEYYNTYNWLKYHFEITRCLNSLLFNKFFISLRKQNGQLIKNYFIDIVLF